MSPARVLLVDDDPLFIRRAQSAFDESVDLQVVSTGTAALRATAGWQPNVVVLDMFLREGDTFDVLDELRQRRHPGCRGVICLVKGPGAATHFEAVDGTFLGVLRREAGTDGLRDAVNCALSSTAPTAASA